MIRALLFALLWCLTNSIGSAQEASEAKIDASQTTQIRFTGPEGMEIGWQVGKAFAENQLQAPARYNFPQGGTYRLQLRNIAGHEGLTVYPTLQIVLQTADEEVSQYLDHNAVTVTFTDEDFDQVEANNMVTKVFYLPNPASQKNAIPSIEILNSTKAAPGSDLRVEAAKRGSAIAVIRLANRSPQAGDPPLKSEPGKVIPPQDIAEGQPLVASKLTESKPAIVLIIDPNARQSEVVKQVVEALEKAGIATADSPDKVTPSTSAIHVTLSMRSDESYERIKHLVEALQAAGVEQLSFQAGGVQEAGKEAQNHIRLIALPNSTAEELHRIEQAIIDSAKQSGLMFVVSTQIPGQENAPAYDPSTTTAPAPVKHIEYTETLPDASSREKDHQLAEAVATALRRKGVSLESVGIQIEVQDGACTLTWKLGIPEEGTGTLLEELVRKVPGIKSVQHMPLARKSPEPDSDTPSVKVFTLKYAQATDVAEVLKNLYDKGPAKIAADARTNSVIVTGPEAQLEEIEALLLKLDEGAPANPNARSVPVDPAQSEAAKLVVQLEDELAQLQQSVGANHPKVKELQGRIAAARQNVQAENVQPETASRLPGTPVTNVNPLGEIEQLDAEGEGLRERLEADKKNLERTQALMKKGVVSAQNAQEAEASVQVSEALLAAHQAQRSAVLQKFKAQLLKALDDALEYFQSSGQIEKAELQDAEKQIEAIITQVDTSPKQALTAANDLISQLDSELMKQLEKAIKSSPTDPQIGTWQTALRQAQRRARTRKLLPGSLPATETLFGKYDRAFQAQAEAGSRLPAVSLGNGDGTGSTSGEVQQQIAQLRKEYEAADSEARQLARQLQTTPDGAQKNEAQKADLRRAVQRAFTARQSLLRAELLEMHDKLLKTQRSIDLRERISDQIIQRRVDDLLNPQLEWEGKTPAGPPLSKAAEAKPRDLGQETELGHDPKSMILAKLQGIWNVEVQSEDLPKEKPPFKFIAEIRDNVMTWSLDPPQPDNDKPPVFLIKLGEPGTPQPVDLVAGPNDGEDQRAVLPGIMEVNGDLVRICVNVNSAGTRPEVLVPGKNVHIYVLRRPVNSPPPGKVVKSTYRFTAAEPDFNVGDAVNLMVLVRPKQRHVIMGGLPIVAKEPNHAASTAPYMESVYSVEVTSEELAAITSAETLFGRIGVVRTSANEQPYDNRNCRQVVVDAWREKVRYDEQMNAVGPAAEPSPTDPKAAMLAKLQGVWKAEFEFEEDFNEKDNSCFVDKSRFVVEVNHDLMSVRKLDGNGQLIDQYAMLIRLGDVASPQPIDLIREPEDTQKRSELKGIIELKYGQVSICFGDAVDRPKSFGTLQSGIQRLRLRRPSSKSPQGLGVTLDLDPISADKMPQQFRGGVRIDGNYAGGAAEKGGIRSGDILVGLGDWEIAGWDDLQSVIKKGLLGEIPYFIVRDGVIRKGYVRLNGSESMEIAAPNHLAQPQVLSDPIVDLQPVHQPITVSNLQGSWNVHQTAPRSEGPWKIDIHGQRLTIDGLDQLQYEYQLGEGATQPIDFVINSASVAAEDEQQKYKIPKRLGIIRKEDGVIRICFSPAGSDERPMNYGLRVAEVIWELRRKAATGAATELEGEWHLESATDANGKPRDIQPDNWTIRGRQLVFDFSSGGHDVCQIDVDSQAKTIRWLKDGQEVFSPSDYVLRGDQLTLHERPNIVKVLRRGHVQLATTTPSTGDVVTELEGDWHLVSGFDDKGEPRELGPTNWTFRGDRRTSVWPGGSYDCRIRVNPTEKTLWSYSKEEDGSFGQEYYELKGRQLILRDKPGALGYQVLERGLVRIPPPVDLPSVSQAQKWRSGVVELFEEWNDEKTGTQQQLVGYGTVVTERNWIVGQRQIRRSSPGSRKYYARCDDGSLIPLEQKEESSGGWAVFQTTQPTQFNFSYTIASTSPEVGDVVRAYSKTGMTLTTATLTAKDRQFVALGMPVWQLERRSERELYLDGDAISIRSLPILNGDGELLGLSISETGDLSLVLPMSRLREIFPKTLAGIPPMLNLHHAIPTDVSTNSDPKSVPKESIRISEKGNEAPVFVRFQGRWEVDFFASPNRSEQWERVEIKGSTLTCFGAINEKSSFARVYRLTLGSPDDSRAVDLQETEGNQTFPGLMEKTRDGLALCLGLDGKRPAEFGDGDQRICLRLIPQPAEPEPSPAPADPKARGSDSEKQPSSQQ